MPLPIFGIPYWSDLIHLPDYYLPRISKDLTIIYIYVTANTAPNSIFDAGIWDSFYNDGKLNLLLILSCKLRNGNLFDKEGYHPNLRSINNPVDLENFGLGLIGLFTM